MAGNPLLEVSDLEVRSTSPDGSTFTACLGELTLRPGELCFMVGASGCGKSTLLECFGLLRDSGFTAGKLWLLGHELRPGRVASMRDKLLATAIGYMPQQGGLLPFLTVDENFKLRIQNAIRCGSRRKESEMHSYLDQLINSFDGDDGEFRRCLNMRPEALSLGQRQRALFCMGAACLPDLMLLDEPTSALDPDNGKRLLRIIKALAKLAGIGILMVTHDRSLTCGERVIAYDEGQSRARTAAVGNHEIFGYFSEVVPAGAQ